MNVDTACLGIVDDDSFNEVVEYSKEHPDNLLIVDFWANWCGPCKMLGPVFNRVAEDYCSKNEKVKFYSADAEESGVAMSDYSIRSVPTILFIKAGEKLETLVGLQTEPNIRQKIETLAA